MQKFFVLKELAQQDNKIRGAWILYTTQEWLFYWYLHVHVDYIFMLETVKEACVEVDCISASWSQDQENLILNNISFKVDKVKNIHSIYIVVKLLCAC